MTTRKLYCSCSEKTDFERYELATDLLARRCPKCLAVVLSMNDYRPWIERHFSDRSTVEPSALPGSEKSSKVRFCPSCQRIMARYRTGDANSFWLEYCPACGFVCLDAGEWEQLERCGLSSYLDIILTERWQKHIQSNRTSNFRDDILRERFGEEVFVEIQRIARWLGNQTNGRDILVCLSELLSEKNMRRHRI
jgi:hypothetical protein